MLPQHHRLEPISAWTEICTDFSTCTQTCAAIRLWFRSLFFLIPFLNSRCHDQPYNFTHLDKINELTWWWCPGWIRSLVCLLHGCHLFCCWSTWRLGSFLVFAPRQVVPRLPNGLDDLWDHLKSWIKCLDINLAGPVMLLFESLTPRPTFFSAAVGWTGGLRNSSESGPCSSGSPQSKRVCPGMIWRVTNDFEDSEDQGSEAEDTIRWIVITDLLFYYDHYT